MKAPIWFQAMQILYAALDRHAIVDGSRCFYLFAAGICQSGSLERSMWRHCVCVGLAATVPVIA